MIAATARIALVVAGALWFALHATDPLAVPLGPEELTRVCAGADGLAHCGRRVEEIQLARLPNLATREGDVLHVTLYPNGRTSFADTTEPNGGRTYALWDYLDAVNMVVIYVTQGDDASFLLLQRTNGRTFEIPAEPRLSPDRLRIVTADFCPAQCSNEIAVWRVARDGVRKELRWSPRERWSDASARWKSPDGLEIEFSRADDTAARTIERRLGDPGWTRLGPP